MAVAGLRGTGNWGTDERPKSFAGTVLRLNPAGTAPIFALTEKARKKSVTDPEFSWWAEGNAQVRLQVNGALAAADTLVTVDTADPTVSTLGANFGTASNLKAGDVLWVEPTSDSATFNQELLEVDNILSDTQFTVRRAAGGTSAATIADNVWLTLIGSAYAEGTGIPRAVSRNPLKFLNYTQIFKDTYEITGTADKTEIRTDSDYSGDKKKKAWDHAQKIEYSIILGRKAETVGDNGKPKRFMGGLREFIPASNTTVFGSAVTESSFNDAIGMVFDFDTGAGDTRIAFGGQQAITELSKVFKAANPRAPMDIESVYGMKFTEYQHPAGRILFKTHPLMSRHGLLKKSMFILDFDAIKYVYLNGRDTKNFDDVQNKDEDVRRGYYMTECSLEVGYGGLTMAYLGNISAT